MTRVIITLLLACSVAISQHAQTISRTYQQESLSKVLKDISASSKTYKINFIYNELEDFTVTTTLRNASILNAVKQVVGYYPIHIAIDSTMVFVECTNKAKHKFSGASRLRPYLALRLLCLRWSIRGFLATVSASKGSYRRKKAAPQSSHLSPQRNAQ